MSKKNKQTKRILNENWDTIVKQIATGTSVAETAATFGISRQALAARFNKSKNTKSAKISTLKVLTLDIENAPMLSWHWGLWQQNIARAMRPDGNRSYMMTVAAKWLHSDEIFYYETRDEDDSAITAAILKLVDEADIVVGHNAQKFDMKKINAYAILNKLPPPSPYRVIDTMLIARKNFAFEQNTLEYLSGALCTTTKSAHKKFHGFDLWKKCMQGDDSAWAEMKHYNIQDVIVTEELYLILRPWAKGHPNMVTISNSSSHRCTACGSLEVTKSGYSITNVSKFQRYKCDKCGSFSRERKNLLGKEARDNLLTSVANG